MTPITQVCRLTQKPFVISDEDQALLHKMGMPLPTLCPEERQRRRMSFRNDHMLYHRKCDKTGKPIISLYDTDSPFTIYNQDFYRSDEWNARDYARDFDFNRPFFEQFAELQKVVPRIAINGLGNENCDYTSYAGWSRNCYLTVTADRNQDCYYGYFIFDNQNCVDTLYVFNCQLCYECVDSKNCYHCLFGMNLENCMDCTFCRDCIGCKNCFGCINLRNKEYCFFNEQLTKEEYEARIKTLNLGSYSELQKIKAQVQEFFLKNPRRALDIKGSENVTGDHIKFSRNCENVYDVSNCENCNYVSHFINSKDCMDWDYCGDKSEMGYENSGCVDLKFSAFCTNGWVGNSYLFHCDLMTNSKDCFGCIGLDKGQYCILNKQYTKEEYEALVPRVIEHMKKTGEWGEFFPIWLSPYAYNETVAQDYLPLTEEEANQRSIRWKNKKETAGYQGPQITLPDSAQETPEDICKQILTCEKSGDNYKIIPQELNFYKEHNLALPRRSPNQRFIDRLKIRNPRKQWGRNCGLCQKNILSSYAPDRAEIVYCEECYLKTVY